MKKGLLIFGAVVLLCLGVVAAMVAYATQRAETLYYAPVVNSTGEKVAYVKRLLKYSASGGSIMPFIGGSPTKVRIKSDRIQLCEKDIQTGRESILEDWKIDLVIKNSRGRIQPVLNWDLENLRYVIRMRGFGDIGIGIWRRPYGYLTNLENWSKLKHGPIAAGTIRVRLNGLTSGRFPETNEVVVEKTWVADTELPRIRQKLEDWIEQRLAELDSSPQNRKRIKDENFPQPKAEIDKAKKLSTFIARQKLSRLPDELIRLFFEEAEQPAKSYPDLKPAIVLLGEAGAAALAERYDRASFDNRLIILSLLGEIGSASSLTLVREALQMNRPDLRNAAIVALGNIRGERAVEELHLLLNDAHMGPLNKKTILLQLQQSHDPNWHATVLLTALKEPLIFDQLPTLVPDFSAFPEKVVWQQLPVLFEQLHNKNRRTVLTAQNLIATIRQRNFLSELFPVLEDLLKTRYDYGRTTGVFGGFVKDSDRPGADRILWDRSTATDMLDHIEKTVEDVVMWHANAYRNPGSLLTLLYIENLHIRKGRQIINRPPIKVLLEVSVRDATGSVFASNRQVVVVGKQAVLKGKPLVPGYPAPACEGQFELDKENWRLTFTPLTVRRKRETIALPVSIPFGGACEFKIDEQFQGNKKSLEFWFIFYNSHVYKSNATSYQTRQIR
jgi:hypothetical protein